MVIENNDILGYIEKLELMKSSLFDLKELSDFQDENSIAKYDDMINNISLLLNSFSNELKNQKDYNESNLNDRIIEDSSNLNNEVSYINPNNVMIKIKELNEGFYNLNKDINNLDDMLKLVSKNNLSEINSLKDEISKKDFHIKKLYKRLESFDSDKIHFKFNCLGLTSSINVGYDLNLNKFNIRMKITPNGVRHSVSWVMLGESTSKAYLVGLIYDAPFWGILVRNGNDVKYCIPKQPPLTPKIGYIVDVIYDNGYWVFSIGDNVLTFFDDSINIEKLIAFAVVNATLDFSLF